MLGKPVVVNAKSAIYSSAILAKKVLLVNSKSDPPAVYVVASTKISVPDNMKLALLSTILPVS